MSGSEQGSVADSRADGVVNVDADAIYAYDKTDQVLLRLRCNRSQAGALPAGRAAARTTKTHVSPCRIFVLLTLSRAPAFARQLHRQVYARPVVCVGLPRQQWPDAPASL